MESLTLRRLTGTGQTSGQTHEFYVLSPPDSAELADPDGDGVPNIDDNCTIDANPSQTDSDDDGVGDTCQGILDQDEDGVRDSADNCPDVYNEEQRDSDQDGEGDACEFDDSDE